MPQHQEYAAKNVADTKNFKLKSLDISPIWQKATKNYEILQLIGTGSFGEVVLAKKKSTGKKVAIKLLLKPFSDDY